MNKLLTISIAASSASASTTRPSIPWHPHMENKYVNDNSTRRWVDPFRSEPHYRNMPKLCYALPVCKNGYFSDVFVAFERQLTNWEWQFDDTEASIYWRTLVQRVVHNVYNDKKIEQHLNPHKFLEWLVQINVCMPAFLLASTFHLYMAGVNPDDKTQWRQDTLQHQTLVTLRILENMEKACGERQYRDYLVGTIRLSTEHIKYMLNQLTHTSNMLTRKVDMKDAYILDKTVEPIERGLFAGQIGRADIGTMYPYDIIDIGVHRGADSLLKKNLKNISGTYVSPGSGCVVKKHSVGYVELVFGCLS